MNHVTHVVAGLGLACLCSTAYAADGPAGHRISIIPRPMKCTVNEGAAFRLTRQTVILHDKESLENAEYLAALLRPATGAPLTLRIGHAGRNAIILATDPAKDSLGKEGYTLSVTQDTIRISAAHSPGLFYGIQSLRQLLPISLEKSDEVTIPSPLTVPALNMEDKPRFPWRGMMMDFGRHMFSVETVKQQLDLMALQKLNVFHMHLTEDQGWRIEIKAYPRLTEIGAYRAKKNHKSKDGSGRYGGFFTQEQIREIVAYAAKRHIVVVPEIEMPGHASAALASYPHLGCTGGPYEVCVKWGVKKDLMCAGKEGTFTFLTSVLDEVMQLFPGPYIHLGCDEAPTDRWKECPLCQKRKSELGLKTEHDLQVCFTDRIRKYLAAHGRTVVGWADFLEYSSAGDLTVMVWRGRADKPVDKTLLKALENNHDVIYTTGGHCYYDYGYHKISLRRAYSLNATELAPLDKHHLIKGSQGNLWSEHISTPERLNRMAYPRLTALAEALWTPLDEHGDYEDFRRRLDCLLKRFDVLGITYTPAGACDKYDEQIKARYERWRPRQPR